MYFFRSLERNLGPHPKAISTLATSFVRPNFHLSILRHDYLGGQPPALIFHFVLQAPAQIPLGSPVFQPKARTPCPIVYRVQSLFYRHDLALP